MSARKYKPTKVECQAEDIIEDPVNGNYRLDEGFPLGRAPGRYVSKDRPITTKRIKTGSRTRRCEGQKDSTATVFKPIHPDRKVDKYASRAQFQSSARCSTAYTTLPAFRLDTTASSANRQLNLRPEPIAEKDGDGPILDPLYERRRELASDLLHVTQKLCRKHVKQLNAILQQDERLDPRHGNLELRQKSTLSKLWSESLVAKGAKSGLDVQRRNDYFEMCARHRFASQMKVDYRGKKMDERDRVTDFHHHNTMHTKYGNALSKARHSLRGFF